MLSDDTVLTQILNSHYLDDLRAHSMSDLRSMRTNCDEVECSLSFSRRLLHGRIDIVEDELVRRTQGRVSTPSDLVARLPKILSDSVATPPESTQGSRMVRSMTTAVAQRHEENVEDLLGLSTNDISKTDEESLKRALATMRDREQEVSQRRKVLHQRLDAIQAEMARRYRDGEADVASLLMTE